MIKRKNKKISNHTHGQSMIEYMLMLAAIIMLLLVFLAPGGRFQKSVFNTYQHGTNYLLGSALEIFF